MFFRAWIVIAGLLGASGVLAGAYGAHALGGANSFSAPVKVWETAQLYHMLHALALLGVAALMAATERRRTYWGAAMLQIAAGSFALGALLFSGGLYGQISQVLIEAGKAAPAGGILLIAGWIALALSAPGLRLR